MSTFFRLAVCVIALFSAAAVAEMTQVLPPCVERPVDPDSGLKHVMPLRKMIDVRLSNEGHKLLGPLNITLESYFTLLSTTNITAQDVIFEVTPYTTDDQPLLPYTVNVTLKPFKRPEDKAKHFVYTVNFELREALSEGAWDVVNVAGKGCFNVSFGVYRTDNCPIRGYTGYQLDHCHECFSTLQCPGGAREIPLMGQCVQNGLVRSCDPPESCKPALFSCSSPDDCPEEWPYEGTVTCGTGYAPKDGRDTCCEGCSQGYRRFIGLCIASNDFEGTSTWEAASLSLALSLFVALGWAMRRETLAFVPVLLQLYRMSQLISLIVMNISYWCESQPTGFPFMLGLFPVLTGLSDYYSTLDDPTARFFEQISFLVLYLLALLVTPLVLFIRERINNRQGRFDHDEIKWKDSMSRSFTLWFFLFLPTLLYVSTGQLMCVKNAVISTLEADSHPYAHRVIPNYRTSECPTKSYIGAVVLSLSLFVGIVAYLVRVWRRVNVLCVTPDANIEQYQRYAFLYANMAPTKVRMWFVELVLVFMVVSLRSFFTSRIVEWSHGLMIVLLLLFAIFVIFKRPFMNIVQNVAFVLLLLVLITAVGLRITLVRCGNNPPFEVEGTIVRLEEDMEKSRNALSITVVIGYVVCTLLYIIQAIRSRRFSGKVRYFHGMATMNSSLMENAPQDPSSQDTEMHNVGPSIQAVGDL